MPIKSIFFICLNISRSNAMAQRFDVVNNHSLVSLVSIMGVSSYLFISNREIKRL